ncbi:YadA family autotransporter adhesin [Thermosynechococcus vestitus]|uniref:Tlr2132 protein n=1 Tax=Thermosynechococcus vestitus (strain NIES-2133 / IAM M-273 / BP-1) TaxID=197221 RepID=Q8DH28_THEVB|nr:tlr2132 [Thermosynechococcus vestitus BP-1]
MAAGANDGVAIGKNALANQPNSVAIGANSVTTAPNAVSVGNVGAERKIVNVAPGLIAPTSTDAINGSQLSALINQLFATGICSITGATVTCGNIALGSAATPTGANSIAIGNNSIANAPNAIAFGPGAQAIHPNSVAIGAGSVTTAPNTVSVGAPGAERRITNVATPINPTDAVNKAYVDGIGAAALGAANAYTDSQINQLRGEAFAGIASVSALLPVVPARSGQATFNVGFATYGGYSAAGIAMAYQIGAVVINGGASFSSAGYPLGRIGIGIRF